MLQSGSGGLLRDSQKAARYFQKAAEQGDPSGAFLYAFLLHQGVTTTGLVSADPKQKLEFEIEAAKWFTRAGMLMFVFYLAGRVALVLSYVFTYPCVFVCCLWFGSGFTMCTGTTLRVLVCADLTQSKCRVST
jgi:hypothetical protein